jgi:hypothetical protein
MKTTTLALLALASMAIATSDSRAQQGGAQQLVNVATASFGAKGQGVGEKLVEGEGGTLAAAASGQAAFTVINLAGEVEMNRVALDVGQQKGKIRIVALKDDGTPDLSSGRVITEFELDGSKPTVSADVSDVKVKRVAIVWVPDNPGQPLTLSNVGLFTSKPEPILQVPEVRALQQAAAVAAPAPAPAPAAQAAAAPAPAASGGTGAATSSSAAAASPATNTTAAPVAAPTPVATPPAPAPTPVVTPPAPVAPVAPPAVPPTTAISVPPQTRNVSR